MRDRRFAIPDDALRKHYMDAFNFIAKEHRRLERALTKLADTPAAETEVCQRMFANIRRDLEIHMKIEESILYPLLRKQTEMRGGRFSGFSEHDKSRRLLQDLAELIGSGEQWGERLEELKKIIKEHHDELEQDLFPVARGILSQEEIDDLGRRLLTAREEFNEQIAP